MGTGHYQVQTTLALPEAVRVEEAESQKTGRLGGAGGLVVDVHQEVLGELTVVTLVRIEDCTS